jgi:hypothetical protein
MLLILLFNQKLHLIFSHRKIIHIHRYSKEYLKRSCKCIKYHIFDKICTIFYYVVSNLYIKYIRKQRGMFLEVGEEEQN